jgi:hypothetical protein
MVILNFIGGGEWGGSCYQRRNQEYAVLSEMFGSGAGKGRLQSRGKTVAVKSAGRSKVPQREEKLN